MKNKLTITSLLVVALFSGALLSANFTALADEDSNWTNNSSMIKESDFRKIDKKLSEAFEDVRGLSLKNMPHETLTIIGIGANSTEGRIRMTEANLDAISGTDLEVSVWGMKFKIDASRAKITGPGRSITISDMKVADKLLINGQIDKGTNLVIAEVIFDRSLQRQAVTDIEARINALLEQIKKLQEEFKKSQQGN
ncbi:MAG TPA: hypothetical protein VI432_02145 [Candidatus Paceibacterota bacterium]